MLANTPTEKPKLLPKLPCFLVAGVLGRAAAAPVYRAALGTLAQLSHGSSFKPDWVHWVYRRPCRCPFLKGALLFHGNDLWSPNVFI